MSVVTVRRDSSPWRSADRLAEHTGGSRPPGTSATRPGVAEGATACARGRGHRWAPWCVRACCTPQVAPSHATLHLRRIRDAVPRPLARIAV